MLARKAAIFVMKDSMGSQSPEEIDTDVDKTTLQSIEAKLPHPIYVFGASFLTALTCSYGPDIKRSKDVFFSLCARHLWRSYQKNQDNPQRITARPQYLFRELNDIHKCERFVAKRIDERLAAGRVGIAFLKRSITGEVPKLPEGVKRLSVAQLCEYVAPQTRVEDPDNFRRRCWRPARSVMHMAAAIAWSMQEFDGVGEDRRDFTDLDVLTSDPLVVMLLWRRARQCAELISGDPLFPVETTELMARHTFPSA